MKAKSPLLFWIGLASLAAAVGVHLYLLDHHYSFKYGAITGDSFCNVSNFLNCDRASASKFSELLGIPVAMLGAIFNFLILFLMTAQRWPLATKKTQENLPNSIKILCLGLVVVSLTMATISLGLLNTLCPFCMLAYALSVVTFVSVWSYYGFTMAIGKFELTTIGTAALVTLGLGFVLHKASIKNYIDENLLEIIDLQYTEWQNKPVIDFEAIDPVSLGDQNSPMQIVEFADFLCGHCKNAFPKLHSFMKSHPDVHFSFQAWPLDGACNPAVGHSRGTSCLLARISHCAGKQQKGFEAQEWIFDNQHNFISDEVIHGKIPELASLIGIDNAQLDQCIESEESHKVIRQQAEVGQKAGVQGTPTIFINGKKLPGLSAPLLNKIYRELKK